MSADTERPRFSRRGPKVLPLHRDAGVCVGCERPKTLGHACNSELFLYDVLDLVSQIVGTPAVTEKALDRIQAADNEAIERLRHLVNEITAVRRRGELLIQFRRSLIGPRDRAPNSFVWRDIEALDLLVSNRQFARGDEGPPTPSQVARCVRLPVERVTDVLDRWLGFLAERENSSGQEEAA